MGYSIPNKKSKKSIQTTYDFLSKSKSEMKDFLLSEQLTEDKELIALYKKLKDVHNDFMDYITKKHMRYDDD